MTRPRVILIVRDSPSGHYVAAGLARVADRIMLERHRASRAFYWRKLRRVGPANAVFQVLQNRWYDRETLRHLSRAALPAHERIRNANHLTFENDDLVIGFGTSFITAQTLARVPRGFLNLHTGWLPEYRGVKSEFWTLALHDEAHAGWTLHYMTPGLDEGDIVLRRRVPVNGENPPALRATLLRDAVPALVEFIAGVREHGFDSISRQPQNAADARYFTTPTWRDWRCYRRARSTVSSSPPDR